MCGLLISTFRATELKLASLPERRTGWRRRNQRWGDNFFRKRMKSRQMKRIVLHSPGCHIPPLLLLPTGLSWTKGSPICCWWFCCRICWWTSAKGVITPPYMEAMRFELLVIGLFHHGITAMSSTWTVAGFGFIRGKTANWTPPKKTRTAKLQTKELPKLLSASCWY